MINSLPIVTQIYNKDFTEILYVKDMDHQRFCARCHKPVEFGKDDRYIWCPKCDEL